MMKAVPAALAALLLIAAAEPAGVAPPEGAKLILEAAAEGVQIYACEAKDQGYAWVFKAPEAMLFDKDGRQVIHHFAGPSWQTDDGATVVGEVMSKADASTAGAIPWLLLKTKSRTGTGPLADTAFIRRIDTKEGNAPATGCDAAHAGQQAKMRYSAVYQFYSAGK